MASDSGVQPFVTHFQGKTKLTSCDFLKIFKQFDKDGRMMNEAFFSAVLFCSANNISFIYISSFSSHFIC